MLIQASVNSNRTNMLINEYSKLIQNGIKSEKILVLVQNSKKRKEFISKIKEISNIGFLGSFKIFTFFGFINNYIIENWPIIENNVKSDENRKISPVLCGLEVSQFILNNCINEVDFTGYNSKTSLLHQLLRRSNLINLNNLSDDEVNYRTKILQESFSKEAAEAINKYKAKTIQKRAFDYIRQLNLFEFLYKKLSCPYEYIFIDDADEIAPYLLSYFNHIKKNIKEFYIAYDKSGSSRLGYLGAINVDFEEFLNQKAINIDSLNNEKEKNAYKIYSDIKEEKPLVLDNINIKSYLKRDEMIDSVVFDIKNLLKQGIKPSEISIVTPLNDDYLKNTLTKIETDTLKFNFLNKSEKLNQNPTIGYILELLKIINKNSIISPYILKGVLIEIFDIDKKEAIKIVQEFKIENQNIFEIIKQKADLKADLKDIFDFYQKIAQLPLSKQLYEIADNYILKTRNNSKNIIKINQLLKQISDFEDVFKNDFDTNYLNNILLTQLSNSIISENPLSDDEIDDNSIVVSTAQKIIDYSHKTKYCFLLDIKNENWIKQDIGPLYNAWVMQKSWNKDSFELTDNIELSKDKTARILRKLYLLSDNFSLYSSSYDSLGIENITGIDKYFENNEQKAEDKKQIKPIIPRPDQKAVLDYKKGKMAVSAAAGSGKTTIMLLLVEKFLEGKIIKDIKAENIFVLTFMESAARNFKERIKAKFPNLKELPNISTIHGLCLRILKENNNYAKLGLDFDFEILDEIKRGAVITKCSLDCAITPDKVALYDSAISAYKNELSVYSDYKTSNRLFLKVFEEYSKILKQENLIDYDDLLFLSLKLLKENKDVLEYYQNKVKVIIEDEAQDSSFVQQSIIKLLSGKFNNIIRCGDINQAITSTFTNSDVTGFRKFIKEADEIQMDRCQRCATGVLDLANDVVKLAKDKKFDAFSNLIMKPVEGKNIIDKKAVSTHQFESEKEEANFIINEIRKIKKEDENASIAILLRNNFLINKWDEILKTNYIKTYKNSDALINNKIYKISLYIMQFISNPYDNKILEKISEFLYEQKIYDKSSLNYAKSLKEPIFLKDDYDEPLFWDMNYFLFKNHSSIYNLSLDIASYYFSNTPQRVNIPLFAALVDKIAKTQKTFEDTVSRLDEIKFRPYFSNIKFFSIDEKDENSEKSGKVQIMTLHKSKGDEFDYVFIPEMIKENYCFYDSELKLKENSEFNEKIKKKPKTPNELKKEIVEENYRLIYVAITRAKKKLFMSAAKKYKYYFKLKDYEPTSLFKDLEEMKIAKN